MKTRIAVGIVLAVASLAACRRDAPPPSQPATGNYAVQPWTMFAESGSMAPDLSLASGGRVMLSWINHQSGRRNALQFNSYTEAGGWQSQPRTIAVGNSLVANWADTPHLLVTPDGAIWAQWLQAGAGPAAYDIVLARSRDGGMTWNQLTRVNEDRAEAEHGFASLWPRGADAIGMAWLDGRGQAEAGDGHHAGATGLRANGFDLDLARGADAVVDARACDCCRTDVALTAKGPLLVYRDRGDDEVRDIAAVRFENGKWGAPKPVHADGWKIESCPVNGPAVAARGNHAVVAWYSEAGGEPVLRLARSGDAGDGFAAPVEVARGAGVLGQVDVALDGAQAWVSWLQEDAQGQVLMLARYAPDLSKRLQQFEVARLQARGHAGGSPKLVVDAAGAWLAWTDVVDGAPRLRGARVVR